MCKSGNLPIICLIKLILVFLKIINSEKILRKWASPSGSSFFSLTWLPFYDFFVAEDRVDARAEPPMSQFLLSDSIEFNRIITSKASQIEDINEPPFCDALVNG